MRKKKLSSVSKQPGSVSFDHFFYLDLHLKVHFEVGEQGKEDGKRQFKYFRHRGDTVFRERHTQVLFDGVHKHLMGSKHRSSTLQHWEQQLQGNNLRAQLMGPERKDRKIIAAIQKLKICLHKIEYLSK